MAPTKRPKVQAQMDPKLRGLPAAKRMEMAVQAVINDKFNQSEASRHYGVSRPRLNGAVVKLRAKLDEQHARAELAADERRAALATVPSSNEPAPEVGAPAGDPTIVRPLLVQNEVRRIPPFKDFSRKYFGNLECPDCGRHHEVPDFHDQIMDAVSGPARRLLVNMPPYHAKSTIATVQHTVYELCRDPNIRVLIVSKSQKLAERFLYQIKQYLQDPSGYEEGKNLIEDWGPFHTGGEQWNNTQIYVAGRQSREKDPSVSALGVGGHIYGIRADIIKFDDIADLENQRNRDRVAEMLTWCTQEAASRVGRNGKLHFIGTRISAGDVYSYLDDLPAFEVLRFPCIVDEQAKQTLWLDHFGFENALEQRDSMSMEQWQLVYQNIDTPGLGASFTPEIVEACYDSEYALGQYDANWALIAGLDPAGAGEQAGYTAMALWGVDLTTGHRYLVDLVNVKQMKAPQLRDQIFDWADRYPLRELRVESNGLQSQLIQYNEEITLRLTNRGVRVVPHITTKHNKWDPNFGVESMATLYHNRMVHLPTKDVASRNRIRPLVEQLLSFPMGRVSDLVMATWFAELGAKDVFQRQLLPQFDPRVKLPPRLARRRRVIDFGERTVSAPQLEHGTTGGRLTAFSSPDRAGREQKLVNVGGTIWVP